jgi:signal transduction histidine kinase
LTFFEQYRWRAMLVGAAIVLQSLLILALLYEDRRRRKAEADSREFLAELTHFDRVATAGVLAASIAHEIRQPLTAVTAHANATLRRLSKDPPEIDKARHALEIIVEEGHRASDVIAGVRTLFRSKNASSRTVVVRMNDLIREVAALLAGELKRNKIELTLELTGAPEPRVQGVEIQLRQVILNLMMNAIEVLGNATVGSRRLQVESKVQSGQNVLIVVKDTGPGIAADALDQIFQPFFTTKEGGMGMGLSICRSIVEAHGGHITVASVEGEGAVFRIFLPYSGPDDK